MTPRQRVLAASLLLALATPLQASAQENGVTQPTPPKATPSEPTPSPLAESLIGDARDAYDSAKLLFEDGDAAGAAAKFKRAHELSGDARLLWNIAVCEKELRHYASAAQLVQRYLNEGGDKLTVSARSDAVATQAALREFYSDFSLDVPPGARITIDGVSVGTSPLLGPIPVDLGRRRISVEKEGFEPFARNVDVPGAAPIALRVTLVALKTTAMLKIRSGGPTDAIAIDGKVVGQGQWQGELRAGEHWVRVTAAGKKSYEAHVPLVVGGSRVLQVTLQDESKASVWPWLAAGAAVVVGAGIGAYFLLKPEDQPGRVPQGELGTIYLPLRF